MMINIVTDDAIEAAAESLFSRGDAGLEFAADPHGYRCDAKAVIAAAMPHLETAIRAQVFAELIAAAEGELRLTTSLNGGKSFILTDWLQEQEVGQ